MNLCIDCIHFRRVQMLDSKGNCRHPMAVILQSPIDGEITYNTAENMRKRVTGCGFFGKLFQPNPKGTVTPESSTFDRMKRWFT